MHNSAAYYKVSSSIARMDLSINSAVSTLNLWNRDARGEWLYIIKIFPTVCHRLFLLFGFEGYISNHARFTLDSLESMQIKRLETCQDGRDKISGAWNYCLLESTTMTRFCASVCVSEKWTHIISPSRFLKNLLLRNVDQASYLMRERHWDACMILVKSTSLDFQSLT